LIDIETCESLCWIFISQYLVGFATKLKEDLGYENKDEENKQKTKINVVAKFYRVRDRAREK
jgi:hypothetical protein